VITRLHVSHVASVQLLGVLAHGCVVARAQLLVPRVLALAAAR
jgi:hypothetical protein